MRIVSILLVSAAVCHGQPYQLQPLGHLGLDSTGSTLSHIFSVNNDGAAVGMVHQYGEPYNVLFRGVHWGANQTDAQILPTPPDYLPAAARSINNAGVIVGDAQSLSAYSALRWSSPDQQVVTLNGISSFYTLARSINDLGVTVGVGGINEENDQGTRALRWNADSTSSITLGHLGLSSEGFGHAQAHNINSGGVVVGSSDKYDDNTWLGDRAVWWDANSTTPNELPNLGEDDNGYTEAGSYSVNDQKIAVGFAAKYVDGEAQSSPAVKWDLNSGTIVELGVIGTAPSGAIGATAFDINESGIIVGSSTINGNSGQHAAIWFADSIEAIDLNTLIDPESGWVLTSAASISDTGFIVGVGTNPDGNRQAFRLIPIPEPNWAVLPLMSMLLLSRRSKSTGRST